MKLRFRHKLLFASIGLCLSAAVLPQTIRSAVYPRTADSTGIAAKTETSPADDVVLTSAPEQISLQFPLRVRLVKLALWTDKRDWVDISFRYDPRLNQRYQLDLPKLQNAIYYTADWAILGANERLVRGSFSFSFGTDAEAPSVIKDAEALLLEVRNTGPDGGRYVTPPRTEIIIDRDPPNYDPPFIIELDKPDPDS